MTSSTLVMAGLPGAGKTTFLAALFHLLRKSAANEAGLKLPDLPLDREYFMEVERAWLEYEPLARSRHSMPKGASLPLTTQNGGAMDLSIPDVAGEVFDAVWENGSVSQHLAEIVAVADGTLLFVRADDLARPQLLTERRELKSDEASPEPITHTLDDWPAETAPTQTKLCDILEQLGYRESSHRIAIVISAWDTEEQQGISAAMWIRMHMPLLWQWLESAPSLEWSGFRVSAQGGNVEDEVDRSRLTALPTSTTRLVEGEHRIGDDLTSPIAWLCPELNT